MVIGVIRRFQCFQQAAVTDQFGNGLVQLPDDFFHHRIGFRVNGGGIQRIFTITDPQEAGTLLVCFRAQPGNLQQLATFLKRPVFIPIADDILRQCFA